MDRNCPHCGAPVSDGHRCSCKGARKEFVEELYNRSYGKDKRHGGNVYEGSDQSLARMRKRKAVH